MVPQGRIELPTSPLPRVRSTTELLRRCGAGNDVFAAEAQDPSCKEFSCRRVACPTPLRKAAPTRGARALDGPAPRGYARVMTDDASSPKPPKPRRGPPASEAEQREARLAEALRANLRRRKDRTRAAKATEDGSDDAP